MSANPHISPVFFAFSPEIELSEHSALMGGQFPTKKEHSAFKNPIFYAGKFPGVFPKIELSLLMVQKTSFYTV
jgi:hypothetical protein